MKQLYVISLIALFICGCSGGSKQQGETVANDLSFASTDSADDQALATGVLQRVEAMYKDVFRHFSEEKDASWSSDIYFSNSLFSLWHQMPDDELVIDSDPWTMAQDFDTLACKGIDILFLEQDSALVNVVVFLSDKWPSNTIQLKLVREQHKDADQAEWYIDDFRSDDYSVASQIKDYLKESQQDPS